MKWKISAHLSGIGGLTGGVFAFCYVMAVNPVWLMILMLVMSALTAISRIELKAHTPAQTLAGFTVGFLMVFLPGILV
jgi:membrane-associated phospholipid phosphatase